MEGGNLLELALGAVEATEDHRDAVEDNEYRDEEELKDGSAHLNVAVVAGWDLTLVVNQGPAADAGDDQGGDGGPSEVELGEHKDEEGDDDKEEWEALLGEYQDGGGDGHGRVDPVFAEQMRIAEAALKDGDEGWSGDGDADGVAEKPPFG